MAYTWPQGFESEFFSPDEFSKPELMDPAFIADLDTLRMRCGFPIQINNDARDDADMARIYAKEIAKGQSYPTNSAHLFTTGGPFVRAVDCEPSPPKHDDGSDLDLNEREIELTYQVTRLYKEGRWPKLGLGIETGHWHVDDTPRLGDRRPSFWVAVSK